MKAVCFLCPTREHIARIRLELREPRFGEYHLFFTNRVEDMRLQDLAEMDVKEMVPQGQESFGDFVALELHLSFWCRCSGRTWRCSRLPGTLGTAATLLRA